MARKDFSTGICWLTNQPIRKSNVVCSYGCTTLKNRCDHMGSLVLTEIHVDKDGKRTNVYDVVYPQSYQHN